MTTTSKDFKDLAEDMQEKIFSHISDKEDLLECQLTCKSWRKLNAKALYKSISFDSGNIDKADGFLKALNGDKKHFRSFVKHIQLDSYGEDEEQYRTLLHFFADNCPNIRTAYLNCKIEDSFFLKELHHENWTRLESVSFGGLNRTKLAVEIAKQHEGTIKELVFHKSDASILLNEKDNEQGVKEVLAKFKSLEKVSIFGQSSSHLSSFDNVIPENLMSLELISKGLPQESHPSLHHHVDLEEINPCINIKNLKLNVRLNDDSSIRYLMHKFPKLEMLEYDNQKTLSVSEDTREAFTDYLINIKTFRFCCALEYDSNSQMDCFFIKKLIENSKENSSKEQCNVSAHFHFSRNYGYKNDYFNKETNKGVESYEIGISLDMSPVLDFLKIVGADLTELEITKSDGDELSLSQIFKHCPNLNRLNVNGFDVTLDKNLKQNTMNLKSLKYFSYERLTSDILSRWFKFFPNLTELTFKGSKDTTIDVSSIITAFPNLDRLEIINAELFLSNPIKTSSTIKTLILDKCKLPTSDLFSCLPKVHHLDLYISGHDLKSNRLVINIPKAYLKSVFIAVKYDSLQPSTSLLKVTLPVDGKQIDNNKQYYSSRLGSNAIKKRTEAECKSIISENTRKSDLFQLVVNCKNFPRIIEFSTYPSTISLIAGPVKH